MINKEELLQEILQEEKISWWQVDCERKVFICSELLCQILGLSERELSYNRFIELVAPAYRNILVEVTLSDKTPFTGERIFPMIGPSGEVWLRWKLLKYRAQSDEKTLVTGYVQQFEPTKNTAEDFHSVERTNNLLYRLNSISHTLLSFMQSDTIDRSINGVLTDILKIMKGDRAYISEFDHERGMHVCTYEVTEKGASSACDEVNQISMSQTPWWMDQLSKGTPIIFSNLDEMPPEAETERKLLEIQGVKSIFVLPLISHDKLWGYAGIDVLDEPRCWGKEDFQWFASLINIINLCISLQRSDQETQTERDYLQNLYRYMPLGYVRLKILYNRVGNPVDYVVLDSNYAADAIVGMPHDRYVGKTARELGADVGSYLPGIVQTLTTDHFVEVDTPMGEANKILHSILYSTVQDEVICLFSDTTEMRATHDALDRSEKLLRNIYDNIPVGVELYDKNGLLLDLNKKDMEIFGVKNKEEALKINFFENPVVPPDVMERVSRGEEFTFKLYYPFNQVVNYYDTSKSGYIEIYTSVSMLYDAKGEVVNFMLINIDNTEINRAHSRLAEFESSFELVCRFGQVGYARFDLLTCEGFAMPQWFHNMGEHGDMPLNQVIGVYNHVDPIDREKVFEAIKQVKAGEINSFSRDMHILANGEERWTRANVICNPLNNDPSKIEMVCVNYDITELKMTEKNLIEAKNKAEVSDRLKSAFLANMSHEIRTPLNAIVGFSGLLAETDDQEERRGYMGIVQENNELLLKLISDILDLSKIEAGTLEFHNVELDVKQICLEVVRSLSIKVGNKPIELRLAEQLPECTLVSDKARLMQVLTNFINNALKFTEQGSITLGCCFEDEKSLTFYVEDTGKGIPAEEQEMVFGRFVKLDTFAQGTGLGLAICKSIVEQLGGRIGVESEVGKGSRFWFSVPYTKGACRGVEVEVIEESVQQSPESQSTHPVVLVAEDTDSNFMLLDLLLKKEYEVVRANDGVEAVRLYHEVNPDIILMDMKMPQMDGMEATRLIRTENQEIPILAVTAFAYDQDRQKALEAGCNDYLSKPVSKDALKSKLRTFLKQ